MSRENRLKELFGGNYNDKYINWYSKIKDNADYIANIIPSSYEDKDKYYKKVANYFVIYIHKNLERADYKFHFDNNNATHITNFSNWKWINNSCWIDSFFVCMLGPRDSPFIDIVRHHEGNENLHNEIKQWIQSISSSANVCFDNSIRAKMVEECKKLRIEDIKKGDCARRYSGTQEYGKGATTYILDLIFAMYNVKYKYRLTETLVITSGEISDKINSIKYENNKFTYDGYDLKIIDNIQESINAINTKKFTDNIIIKLYSAYLKYYEYSKYKISINKTKYENNKLEVEMYVIYEDSAIRYNLYDGDKRNTLINFNNEKILKISDINSINMVAINRLEVDEYKKQNITKHTGELDKTQKLVPETIKFSNNIFKFRCATLGESGHYTSIISDNNSKYYKVNIGTSGRNTVTTLDNKEKKSILSKYATYLFYFRSFD